MPKVKKSGFVLLINLLLPEFEIMEVNCSFMLCKNIVLVFACSFFFQISSAQSPSQNNIFTYKKVPLEKVLNEWNRRFDIAFSYDYDLIKKYTVSQNFAYLSLEDKLVKLFRETPIEFKVISQRSIVLKKRSPSFLKKYETKICGQVRDADLGTPLSFVHIILKNTGIGTTTDEQGNFSLNAPFVKGDILVFSFLGYESQKNSPKIFKKKPCHSVYLETRVNEIEEIIVRDRPFGNGEDALFSLSENNNATTFKLEKLDDIGGLVEKDVMQTLQLLPGISGSDESASQLHIRGGASGQNLVLYDNIPMYHFGHFFGKIASINPNMVEAVSVEKEGYGAQYGGRVAGIIDIRGKNAVPDSIQFKIEGSLLSGNANIALPFAKKKAAFFIAYRRSFIDFYESPPFKKFFAQTFQNSRIAEDSAYVNQAGVDSISSLIPQTGFYDFNTKMVWQPNEHNHLTASFLQTSDFLTYQFIEGDYYHELDSLRVSNKGFNFQWKHIWKNNFSTKGNFSWSEYKNDYFYVDDVDVPIDSVEFINDNFNRLEDYSFQLLNSIHFKDQQLNFGLHFNKIKERIRTFARNPGWDEDYLFEDDTTGITQALFLDYHFNILKKMHFNFGGRLTHYDLTDSIYFEPRFFIKIHPAKNLTLKLAGGIYYQAINQIVESNHLNAEDHTWVLSRGVDYDSLAIFPVVKNGQYSVGLSYKKNGWIFDIGAYNKKFEGIASSILRFDNTDFPVHVIGNMLVKGIEASLQKKGKWFYTFAGYTLNRVNYDFEYPEYIVPASYHRLHNFSLLQGFIYKNFNLSATWKLATGRPYTSIKSVQEWGIDYGKINQNRLPAYHRLDLTFSWKFTSKFISGKITLAALNISNRPNDLQRFYKPRWEGSDPFPKVIQHNRKGVPFTPNAGVLLEFSP